MPNPFIHIELQTRDVEKSKRFYSGLFDWKMEDFPAMDYTIINVGDGTGGGMMKNPMPGTPDSWLPYVLVDDVTASTKKALALGAAVVREVTEVAGMGWFSLITDPTGAVFGLWQPKAMKREIPETGSSYRPQSPEEREIRHEAAGHDDYPWRGRPGESSCLLP